ncbi:MAG: peptidyl-prolyl cis-trans isomerase [Bacteroidales bacterium]|nr:peptidyl-prolyl cis-trans isomerase [Bacteroidales bacterium]
MRIHKRILTNVAAPLVGAVSLLGALTGCSKGDEPGADDLVRVGKAALTREALSEAMPRGLSADDSTKYAHAYIKQWINNQLVRQVAANEIDMTEIDKMVEQYRDELIMWEYGRLMFDSHANLQIPEDSIRAFYEANKDEFVLSRPMVKGVYIKAADDASALPEMRKLYRSHTPADIDKLDKVASTGAVHYDYFRDRWIDWEQIESRIPYDFGPSPDAYLRSNKTVDYTHGGFAYLFDATDVLYTGQTMPYEAAHDLIVDRLTFRNKRNYDEQLKRNLYENALEVGKISIFCDLE